MMTAIPDRVRADFPVLARKTYLNSGSYGALCLDVKAAIEAYMESRMVTGADWPQWVGKLEETRALLAQLLGCAPDEVSVSASVSESVNSLASALEFSGGRDTVVVTDFDFPTTSQIWLAQARRGARIVRATADNSGTCIPIGHFDRLIDERTLLVSIPHVCYRNGVRTDPAPIVELCRRRGAMVLLDAYQSVGSMPVDAHALGVDFLVGGCLKYLLGTAGVGFMYVRGGGATLQPAMTGWFAQENIGAMDIHHHRPSPTARRFESGTPNVCGLYAVAAGLRYLMGIGLDAVDAQVRLLTGEIARRARARGWCLVTPPEPENHGATMALAATDAPALVARLAAAGIIVSDRDGNVRLSTHFYNNLADLDHLFAELERNAALVRRT